MPGIRKSEPPQCEPPQYEQLNRISEIVLGYREGTYRQILVGLEELKSKAAKYQQNLHVEQLFTLIDDLAALKSDVLEDCELSSSTQT